MRDALIGWIGGSLVGTVLCLWDPFGFDAPDHVRDATEMVQPAPVTTMDELRAGIALDAAYIREHEKLLAAYKSWHERFAAHVEALEAESAVAAPTGRVR